MRIFKLIGVLVCAVAISAIAVTAASASTLPGVAGTSITGVGEKATLQVKGGASITCPKSTTSGEILSTSEGLAVISFGPKCTTAGLPFNSLGDEPGVILVHVEIKECLSNAGVLRLAALPLHLEVPSTKLLITIEGTVLATVAAGVKQSTFPLTITQKEGKNTIETCGKEKLVLSTSTDGSEFVQSGLETKNTSLTFSAEEEFM
ncbi:MAG TPA: hypothetical protein VK774_05255 [Solirubrobacteraceae bacterium]|nr:hypothetical protein [Solirubrobacteraceae bacterium]